MPVKNDYLYEKRDKFGCITSQSGAYKIHVNEDLNSDRPGIIYIQKGLSVQYPFLHNISQSQTPPGYLCYQYNGIWNAASNDCLDFAESLSNNYPGTTSDICTFVEPKSNVLFGDNDITNVEIVRGVKSTNSRNMNNYANPGIGEAYAFVLDHDYKVVPDLPDIVPFHIAYVVFKDGSTNITLEANSGANLTNPMFDMYDTRIGSENTFQKITKTIYTAGYAERNYRPGDENFIQKPEYIERYMDQYTTIVLQRRPDFVGGKPRTCGSKKQRGLELYRPPS